MPIDSSISITTPVTQLLGINHPILDPFGLCIIKKFVKDSASDHRLLTIVSVGSAGRHSHIVGGADVDQFAAWIFFGVHRSLVIPGYQLVVQQTPVTSGAANSSSS
jgi:hypothetical protein